MLRLSFLLFTLFLVGCPPGAGPEDRRQVAVKSLHRLPAHDASGDVFRGESAERTLEQDGEDDALLSSPGGALQREGASPSPSPIEQSLLHPSLGNRIRPTRAPPRP